MVSANQQNEELKKEDWFYFLCFLLNKHMKTILIHVSYFQYDCGQEKMQIMKHG